jgi:glycosyltransferase involved in cell wall biosynthesis
MGSEQCLKVAMIVADERDIHRRYSADLPWFGPAPTALLEGMARRDDVEVHIISCVRGSVIAPERLDQNIFYHAVRVPRWAYLRTLYMPAIWKIRSAVRRLQPDLVHGQGTEGHYAIAAVHCGLPSLVTILGNMRAVAKRFGARRTSFHGIIAGLEAYALRRADGVCCNSEYTRRQVEPLCKRTFHVPNAVHASFLLDPLPPRDGVPRFVNVGTIVSYKQQVELLELASRLHARGRSFHLEFVGGLSGGEYSEQFLRALERAKRAGFASWSGYLDRKSTIARLDAATAMIHVSAEESFGLAVAEGLARNLRVFAFASGGVTDIIDGMLGAVSIAPGNWIELEAALENWMSAGSVGIASATQVEQRYSSTVVARDQLEAYRLFLSAKPR